MTHACFRKLDRVLRPKNTRLSWLLSVGPRGQIQAHVQVVTEKIDEKKRGRPARVAITYCPFCGKQVSP